MQRIITQAAGRAVISGSIAVLVMAPATASANGTDGNVNIPAGQDHFSISEAGFNLELPPDFFGPGSEPFAGTITCGGQDEPGTDTIIERKADIILPPPPSSDTIPIEIVALQLVSCQPIVVNLNDGSQQQWNVQVGLSPNMPPLGQMTITRANENGGTFDAQLPVQPRFVFTRITAIDLGYEPTEDAVEFDATVFEFSAHDVPWTVCPGTTAGFCPEPVAFGAENGWMNLIPLPPALPNDTCEFPLPNGGLVVLPTPHNPNPSSDKAQSPDQLRRAADRLEAKGFVDEANRLRLIAEAIETIQQGCAELDDVPPTPPGRGR